MITADRSGLEVPRSFLDRYRYIRGVTNGETGKTYLPLASVVEAKFYSSFEDTQMFKDIQEILNNSEHSEYKINLILLHECGGITKVEIHKDKIIGMEPTAWKPVQGVEHYYCYGCSDYGKLFIPPPVFPESPPLFKFSPGALEPAQEVTRETLEAMLYYPSSITNNQHIIMENTEEEKKIVEGENPVPAEVNPANDSAPEATPGEAIPGGIPEAIEIKDAE